MKTNLSTPLNAITCEASKTSAPIDLGGIYGFFIQWQVSGTPTGNIVVLASADGINYVAVSTTAIGTGYVNLDAQFYQSAKVQFSRTTGVIGDTITAQMFCKGV